MADTKEDHAAMFTSPSTSTLPSRPSFKRCSATMVTGKRKGQQCVKISCIDRDMCYVHIILQQSQSQHGSQECSPTFHPTFHPTLHPTAHPTVHPTVHKRSRRVCFEDEERTTHAKKLEFGMDLCMEDWMKERAEDRIIIPAPIDRVIIPFPIADPNSYTDPFKLPTLKRSLTNSNLVY